MTFGRRLTALAAFAAASFAILLCCRPAAGGASDGDALVLRGAWTVAAATAMWTAVGSAVCAIALARGRIRVATVVARVLPPGVRAIVRAALIGATVAVPVVTAPAAHAVPAPAPPPSGTVTIETPVVRAPAPERASVRDTRAPHASTPVHTARRQQAHALPPTYTVRPGDNLWRIARSTLIAAGNAHPSETEIARYWRDLIAENAARLRSGNPSLIFPGEIVTLPVSPHLS